MDDPTLTARGVARHAPLTRVVFDRRLRISPSARVLGTLDAEPVVVVTTEQAMRARPEAVGRLRAVGATLEPVPTGGMAEMMAHLGKLKITSLMLEGGAVVHRAAWSAEVVDRVQRYIAPVTLGRSGVAWLGDDLSITKLRDVHVEGCGQDVLIEGNVQRVN